MGETIKKANSPIGTEVGEEKDRESSEVELSSSSELEQLRQQLEAKELEAKQKYDRFLRQTAELENFKRRMAREKGEAIARVESEEHKPNTVVAEHHKGYYLFDRLLRPSLVSVSKGPETKEKKEEAGEVEKG